MTRKEETQQASNNLANKLGVGYSKNYHNGFIAGAEWADKTMIEKACKWLEEHDIFDYITLMPGSYVKCDYKALVKEFRKAMEE